MVMMVSSCSVILSDSARAISVMKADPPSNCVEVGSMVGYGGGMFQKGNWLDNSKIDLKNKAAELGANYIRLETINEYYRTTSGTAYKCPTK